ncbi:MAG: hypothetical protein A2Y08_02720 [Planctomycetes bacterium GWA2_40_7]|nr:MAG: hypothetical protein A2Y08_02720 [Planctomycetes bacterium GWA2_40_7]
MLGIANISKSVNLFNVPVEGQGSVLRHLSGQTVSIRLVGRGVLSFLTMVNNGKALPSRTYATRPMLKGD